jgi:type III secretion protein N (ATPase)
VEGNDMNEPIADETRSILDGHIVLSRKLAAAGHYPAIDVLASISRVMGALVDEHHHEAARKLRAVLAKYAEIELLVQIGEYRKGSDAEADWALDKMARSMPFLRQGLEERPNFDTMLAELEQAVA